MIELKSVNKIYETEAEKVHALKSVNLTIDKAPTKPKDRAREDFTINITKNTMVDKIGITVPIWCFPVKDVEYLI